MSKRKKAMREIRLLIQKALDPKTRKLLLKVKKAGVFVEELTVPKSFGKLPYPIVHFHRDDGKVTEYRGEAVSIFLKDILKRKV